MPLNPAQLTQIQSHLAAGRKIEAIKLYRELTNVGLAEATEMVEQIEAQGPPAPAAFGSSNPQPPHPAELSAEARQSVIEALRAGRKIEAIRLYRQSTGVDLKEAKDAVEAMEATLSPIDKPTPAPRGCGPGVLLLLAVLAAGLLMWRNGF
jgi:ribosomal protein L7/L12